MTGPLNPDTFAAEFLANVGTRLDHVSDPYEAPFGTSKAKNMMPVRLRGKLGQLRIAVRRIKDKYVRAREELAQKAISEGGQRTGHVGKQRQLLHDEADELCAEQENWYCNLAPDEKSDFDGACLATVGPDFSTFIPATLPVYLHGPLARFAMEVAEIARKYRSIRDEVQKALRKAGLSIALPDFLKRVDEDRTELISRLTERWFRELTPQQAAAFENEEEVGAIPEKTSKPMDLGAVTSLRLHCDDATYTVTIDGEACHIDNPTAYMIYSALAAERPQPLTRADLQARIRGCKGRKAVRQLLDMLPEPVRRTLRSGSRGYWIDLSPQQPRKRRNRKKGRG